MIELLAPYFGILLICAGPLLLLISVLFFLRRGDDVKTRLQEVVQDSGGGTKRSSRFAVLSRREIAGSLTRRVLIPWIRWMGGLFGRLTPAGTINDIQRKLIIAGNPMGLQAREFYGIRMGLMLFGIVTSILLVLNSRETMNVALALLVLFFALLLPTAWLNNRMRVRQDRVRRGLPDALDMLSVCASAGLGFDQSLQRVSEHWQTAIGIEFSRVITEMEMGLSRRDAMRNLSNRLDVKEISSFVSFVLQTEQLGLSISETLHSLADQMRIERRLHAQEQAQKIPTKMIIPMAFFIFPALLAIILGPIVPEMLKFLNNFGG